jgi:ATP-binding cassette subfamily B protein RaxB
MMSLDSKLVFFSRNSIPLIRQTEAAECGLACLAMIAGFHGHSASLAELRQRFSVSIKGLTLKNIIDFASNLSMSSRAIKVEPEQLHNVKLPAVLHWNMNHFVVLTKVRGPWCWLHDPARGKRKISISELSESFTGVVLELLPTQDFTRKRTDGGLGLTDFWSKVSGLRRSLFILFALSILLQVFVLISPYYMQLVIDDVLLSNDKDLLVLLAFGFAMVVIFDSATTALRSFVTLQMNSSLSLQMAANLFHHMVRLPVSFFEKRHIGDVLSRFASLTKIKDMLVSGLLEAVVDGLMATTVLVMLIFYSPSLTFVVIISVVLYAILRLFMYRNYKDVNEKQIISVAKEHSHQIETLRAIQTVKLFGAEASREGSWQNQYVDVINNDIKIGIFNIGFQSANKLISGLENVLVIYLGGAAVISGGFSVGMLVAFIAYKSQFVDRMIKLIDKFIQFRMLSLHFSRLSDIVMTNKEVLTGPEKAIHNIVGTIEIKNLSFRYCDATPFILNNISFKVLPGTSVAIVAPSGFGKTTLLKIMLGLLQPNSGQVLVDDIELKNLDQQYCRQQFATVMQDDQLMSGSIRDNICFFVDEIDFEWMEHCARLASVYEDIQAMPMKYSTLIGDMGSSLSGGQKQRILLARALYKRPKVLFMDEATSHLDVKTEQAINDAIRNMKITRVFIAHRPETISSADTVLDLAVLDGR